MVCTTAELGPMFLMTTSIGHRMLDDTIAIVAGASFGTITACCTFVPVQRMRCARLAFSRVFGFGRSSKNVTTPTTTTTTAKPQIAMI